jgi:hypothetical protein
MTDESQPRPKIIVTDTAPPARCSRCDKEIATVIVACTPDNMRPHPVKIPTAYYTDSRGQPVCSDCFAAYQRREREFQAIMQRLRAADRGEGPRRGTPRRGQPARRSRASRRKRKPPEPEPSPAPV